MSYTKEMLMALEEEIMKYEWDEVPEKYDFYFAEVVVLLDGKRIKATSENFESAEEAKCWAEDWARDYQEGAQRGDKAEITVYRLGEGHLNQHDEYHSKLYYDPTEILSLTLNFI